MSSLKIFPGTLFARELEDDLKKDVVNLKSLRVTPNLATVFIGTDRASSRFLSLKKKAAKRIGATLKIRNLRSGVGAGQVIRLIKKLNEDSKIHGIMVQLPLPSNLKGDIKKIINIIDLKKDVDGMREESQFVPPTVKAVLLAIKEASKNNQKRLPEVVVVGAKGFIGEKIARILKEMGYSVTGVDLESKNLGLKTKTADILITSTGKKELIKSGFVKKGASVIDVGAPYGDADFANVVKKASFITPVPGGIGPLTIYYLFENLIEAAKSGLQ